LALRRTTSTIDSPAEQQRLQHADHEHACRGHGCDHHLLRPAASARHAPIEQANRGGDDHRAEAHGWELGHRAGEEQQHDRHDGGRDDPDQLGLAAHLVVHQFALLAPTGNA
jgi:hypothetical protein